MRSGARSGRSRAPEVRILAGRWKGRKLEAPPDARPTSGRAREALFDVLGERIAGARVLDLFAGSGAVGLEAVSRGAASAVLVEPEARGIRRTLEHLGDDGRDVRLIASDAADAVEELAASGERFDLVFADPPYLLEPLAAGLARAARLMERGAVLVLQRDHGDGTGALPGLQPVVRRAYGRNVFVFYELL
ncbi:MAG TPA: RsmD family RNA methyltransferase [Thermoanaerobaculia bacterium]|nr:RsmD family RNA methyltransferase [Thermoanaerobaculia bacterium]